MADAGDAAAEATFDSLAPAEEAGWQARAHLRADGGADGTRSRSGWRTGTSSSSSGGSGSSGSGGTAFPALYNRMARRVAMSEEQRRRRRCVVTTSYTKLMHSQHPLLPYCAYNAPHKPCTIHTNCNYKNQNQSKNWSCSTNFVAVGGATTIARPLHGTKHAHARTLNAGRS